MADSPATRPTVRDCLAARRMAYWNGAVWAIGNGLTSSTLVIYLAMELGVPGVGLAIGLIRAAPRLAGLLRVAAPLLIAAFGGRKRFCVAAYLGSAVVLSALPATSAPGVLPSPGASLAALVLLWCLYHLLEYLGSVALWSWLADAAPVRVRGAFIGRRQRWMVAGQAAAMTATGLFTWGFRAMHSELPGWVAYAVPATLGVCFMLVAVVPLLRMPSLREAAATATHNGRRVRARTHAPCAPPAVASEDRVRVSTRLTLLAPLRDRRFLPLLFFGCWFSLSNGLTQSAQYLYPKMLGAALFVMLALETGMRLGQLAVSPRLGRLADRLGNRPVMFVSLAITASGPLFYFLSTPAEPWWFAGAWLAWIAYAGLNVGLPNLTLKLAPREHNAAYVATFDAASGVCLAAGALLGGLACDWFRSAPFVLFGETVTAAAFYRLTFLAGWIARSLGLVLLLWVVEKPATAP